MNDLDKLSPEDADLVLRAPVMVAILIAGADGDVDGKEIHAAIAFAKKAHKNATPSMRKLFDLVSEDFEDKLLILMQSYPADHLRRNEVLAAELQKLNAIWGHLDPGFADSYYQSIRAIARRIAESSGGFFGIRKIGEAEAQYVDLPMVAPPR
ncbi:MAG: hypothetical protein K1X47_12325 [Cyclobacteriaceae bacterium]|nr:hypothetical protein [Cyclobacteriaceae bacterium]